MSHVSAAPAESWLASNEHAFAVAIGSPAAPTYVVVITRRVTDWWHATSSERMAVIELVDEVKRLLDDGRAPESYDVAFSAGSADDLPMVHLQVNVVPRYGDAFRDAAPSMSGVDSVLDLGPSIEASRTSLVTTEGSGVYRLLRGCFAEPAYDQIDLLVSFVMRSGVDLLAAAIDEALGRGAQIRLLATDYLAISDPAALGFFLDRIGQHPEGGILQARVFSDATTSFHPKAYLFSSSDGVYGTALVGSSNMSASAMRLGVEWNLTTGLLPPLLDEFGRLWDDDRSELLTQEWLESYRRRSEQRATQRAVGDDRVVEEEPEEPVRPWSVQEEAIAALAATRIEGHRAGLVVMATGLGKTWLAAFDSTRPSFRRVLFVAHREEILQNSRDVYRRVRPDGRLTMFTGGDRDPDGDVVFASMQSLYRNLDAFDRDAFDYIVVDEFHHAAAPTYRQVLAHFDPTFLLGLTATPDRTDAADLLALCGDNLVYECGLVEGLNRGLLSPFRYRAIRDVADYAEIPWRSGRFDPAALSEQLETRQRAQQVLEEWRSTGGSQRRALGFCCSITHADFMARYFAENGVRAVAVHTGPTSAVRADALDRLEAGELEVVFSVDLFNEGIDVPAVDLVMMLRPTESPIVFFQQLGRGLRRQEDKSHLEVMDLVGNHRSFLLKARLLAALGGRRHLTDREAVDLLREPLIDLPEGCSIVVETGAVDLLSQLLGAPKRQDRLAELVRAWADDHEGRRPQALEASMVTRAAHNVKPLGGWFGFLDGLGMLSAHEQAVLRVAGPFLLEIEHGAYTKSWKLVMLQAILDMGTLRTSSPVAQVSLASRWRVLRDPRLLADLAGSSSQFADVSAPTEAEWEPYWRKNPINAWIGGNRGAQPWFRIEDDQLISHLEVPAELGPTFDDMAAEIVEYRLHRYLVGRPVGRAGERMKPFGSEGRELDATFVVESVAGRPTSVLFESAGGAGGDGKKRNPDYVACIDLVLSRLQGLGAAILDAYVDSGRVRDLPIVDRRLAPGRWHYPINLVEVDDLTALRRSVLASMAGIGRDPRAKAGGGNSRKAMRLVIEVPASLSTEMIKVTLAGTATPATEAAVAE